MSAHEHFEKMDAIDSRTAVVVPPPATGSVPSGIDLIAAERARQISAEGWTPEHDDEHAGDQMALAAATYALPRWMREVRVRPLCSEDDRSLWSRVWPWGPVWWKPKPDDRVRELVKAGALIAAEIDRIQRARNK